MDDLHLRMARPARGTGITAVIALPFVAFGGFAGYRGVSMLAFWHDAQSWVEGRATIESAEMDRHFGRKQSDTYEAKATYSYSFEGRRYTGTRVGIEAGADNIGDWQERVSEELRDARLRGGEVACFVNPSNPARAVLYRELRIEILGLWTAFSAVFLCVGGGLFAAAVTSMRDGAAGRRLYVQHPGEPWMWKPDWARGEIPARSGMIAVVVWILAVIWNGVSLPISWFIFSGPALSDGKWWLFVFMLFPAIGLMLLYGGVYATIQHRKFGGSALRLATLPGEVGGRFAAELVICGRVGELETVEFRLWCEREVTTGMGKHKKRTKTTIWEGRMQSEVQRGMDVGTAIAKAAFALPPGVPASSDVDESDTITWRLKAEAEIPGVNLGMEFEVPVFVVGRRMAGARAAALGDVVEAIAVGARG